MQPPPLWQDNTPGKNKTQGSGYFSDRNTGGTQTIFSEWNRLYENASVWRGGFGHVLPYNTEKRIWREEWNQTAIKKGPIGCSTYIYIGLMGAGPDQRNGSTLTEPASSSRKERAGYKGFKEVLKLKKCLHDIKSLIEFPIGFTYLIDFFFYQIDWCVLCRQSDLFWFSFSLWGRCLSSNHRPYHTQVYSNDIYG